MKIALAQINPSMGAIDANAQRISHFLDEAQKKGVDLTVFPELALVGYPPKDLLDQEGFIEKSVQVLEGLAKKHSDQTFIVGFVEMGSDAGKGRYNSAAWIQSGRIQFIQRKRLLPTYDVFDENRYFDAGEQSKTIQFKKKTIGITICEDIWTEEEFLGRRLYSADPSKDLKKQGIDLLINISASPFHEGKMKVREKLTQDLVSKIKVPLVYVNLVGGNDELLFDGGSFVLNGDGENLARAKMFEEDLVVVDLDENKGDQHEWPTSNIFIQTEALVMGLRDYVKKCGFKKVVLGLSGGIDSSLVALLAVEALGAENVAGVSMPSQFTSDMSRDDAEKMVQKLGIGFYTVPIEAVVGSYEQTLSDVFSGKPKDTTEENIQARVRGNILMALSNKFGWLVLSTGNKSELAVGYCTQYGDMAGGLAVIADLPKQKVYEMAQFLNQKWKAIPERVFTRPPTAELRPNQKDEDSLPPYSVLDSILELYIEHQKSAETIISKGFDPSTVHRVLKMVDQNEFKRKQAAPGLRLSKKAFGMGRRMPIARGKA